MWLGWCGGGDGVVGMVVWEGMVWGVVALRGGAVGDKNNNKHYNSNNNNYKIMLFFLLLLHR